ncbi:zinc-binding dehydrogenase [[Kitasatospora] papulosa]|uniref:zinc-binding dehydrogenase n=1 Tax=[Kitasatospora] papulosa TaxID=1464011 RepID=UPI0036A2F2E8
MRAIAVSAFRAEPGLVELPKPDPGAGEVPPGGAATLRVVTATPVAWSDYRLAPTAALLDELASAVARGELDVPIDMELPLEKAPQALTQNRAGGARGKTVFAV